MRPPRRPSGSLKYYGGSCWMNISPIFEKNSPEGCRGSGSSSGSQQHFWLSEGLNVREPGHHRGIQGVKSVMVGPVEGPFTVSKEIGVEKGRGLSIGSTITILTPWRPPLWPGLRTCPGKETTLLLMNRLPLQPPRLLFFWKPAKESSTGPTKTLRTP